MLESCGSNVGFLGPLRDCRYGLLKCVDEEGSLQTGHRETELMTGHAEEPLASAVRR